MYKALMNGFKELLRKYGYTISSAAAKGLSRHTLYALSCGRRNVGMKSIRQCSEVLLIPVTELIELRNITPCGAKIAD